GDAHSGPIGASRIGGGAGGQLAARPAARTRVSPTASPPPTSSGASRKGRKKNARRVPRRGAGATRPPLFSPSPAEPCKSPPIVLGYAPRAFRGSQTIGRQ